jgi:hypothetical protein
MLEFLAYVTATTIEGICIFVMGLNLFRFKPREHIAAIAIANFIVSITNYLMEHYNFLYDYSAIFNVLVMILVFIFLLRISVIDSIIMTVMTFAIVFVVQLLMIYVFTLYNNGTLKQLRLEDAKYYLQVLSGLVLLGISWFLNKKHWWFTFIPFKRSFKIRFTKVNVGIVAASGLFVVLLAVFVNMNNLLLLITIFLVLLLVILCFSVKKEKKYD